MMKRQTALLILFPVVLLLLLTQSCGDGEPYHEPYTIQGAVEDFYLQLLDNGGEQPSQPNENSYPKDAFMLAIGVKVDAKTWDEPHSKVSVDLRDPITAIRIYTLNEFDSTHPAGSEITELFRQYPLNLRSTLNDTSEKGEPVTHLAYYEGFFYKALLTPPTPGTHQLKVEMELKSGQLMVHETETFEIY